MYIEVVASQSSVVPWKVFHGIPWSINLGPLFCRIARIGYDRYDTVDLCALESGRDG